MMACLGVARKNGKSFSKRGFVMMKRSSCMSIEREWERDETMEEPSGTWARNIRMLKLPHEGWLKREREKKKFSVRKFQLELLEEGLPQTLCWKFSESFWNSLQFSQLASIVIDFRENFHFSLFLHCQGNQATWSHQHILKLRKTSWRTTEREFADEEDWGKSC